MDAKILKFDHQRLALKMFTFFYIYTARPSCEYNRQVHFVHSRLQDESLQVNHI